MTGVKPKFELSVYRKFIREAAPYVTLVTGKRISAAQADLLSDEALTALALLIDARVEDLNKTKPAMEAGPATPQARAEPAKKSDKKGH